MTVRYVGALAFMLLTSLAHGQSGYVLELSDGKLVDAKSTDGLVAVDVESPPLRNVFGSAPKYTIYFRSCAEAERAGYSEMRVGSPGYRQGLDGDFDGIACEPYRRRR